MRLLAALGLLVAGAVTAVAAVAVHQLAWGLPLAAAATLLAVWGLPPGWWSRLAFAVGWVVMVGWLSVPRPEGDYLLSTDVRGYLVLGLGLLAMVLGVATLPRPTRTRPRPHDEESASGPAT